MSAAFRAMLAASDCSRATRLSVGSANIVLTATIGSVINARAAHGISRSQHTAGVIEPSTSYADDYF